MSANIRIALVCPILEYFLILDLFKRQPERCRPLDRHKLHYSLIRDGLRDYRRPPPGVASPNDNDAACYRQQCGLCVGGRRAWWRYHVSRGFGLSRRKGLPWSSLAASRPRIESRRPSPRKNHKGYRVPRGRAPCPVPRERPITRWAPRAFAEKPTVYYLFSLRLSHDAVSPR